MKTFLRGAFLTASFLAGPALAWAAVGMSADHGAVWQTAKIGATTQGFLQIHNSGTSPDVLTGWGCPVADTTTLVGSDGKALTSLTIPAGQSVSLAENGPHLLLQGTHFTVDYGSLVPCSLTFQNAGDISVYLNAVPAP
jgi:copper(I)-binding protein